MLKGCEKWFSPLHPLSRYCDEPTPPRPATEYQQLLFEESDQHDNTEEDTDKEEGTGQEEGDRQEDDTGREEGDGLFDESA